MNASDITNALALSPGFISALGTSSSLSYTALSNIEVIITCATSSGSAPTINGLPVALTSGMSITMFFAKGQVLSITTPSGGTLLVTGRSIQ